MLQQTLPDYSLRSRMSHTWVERPFVDFQEVPDGLACDLDGQAQIFELLSKRGTLGLGDDLSEVEDPFALQDCALAASVLADAIQKGRRILIHGDYDVDGTTGASLLQWGLLLLGAKEATAWIPDRRRDGYGLSHGSLEAINAYGADVLLTVDCGIIDDGLAAQIEAEGCQVVITDHHLPGPELPRAHAVVNPQRADDTSENKGLCGAGVAWQVLRGTHRVLHERGVNFGDHVQAALDDLVAFVAVATIADVVPLGPQNQILVRAGLGRCKPCRWPGLAQLFERLLGPGVQPSAEDIGWKVGPTLNAKGRLSTAIANVNLMTGLDSSEIESAIDDLVATNQDRRALSSQGTEMALRQLSELSALEDYQSLSLVLPGVDEGVVGIIAGRVVEITGRPTVVFANQGPDRLKGSMRGVSGMHCRDLLSSCSDHILRFGGHSAAAGLAIEASEIDGFRRALEQAVRAATSEPIRGRVIPYDLSVTVDDCTPGFFAALDQLGPWGNGNPAPVLKIDNVRLEGRGLERRGRGGPLVGKIRSDWPEITYFPRENALIDQLTGRRAFGSLLVEVSWNRWRGARSVQLGLVDWVDAREGHQAGGAI